MIKVFEQLNPFAVIGDIHECVKELRTLEAAIPPDCDLYSTGDYLNKGGNTEKVLKELKRLKDSGRLKSLAIGNHEYYAYRRLSGKIPENKRLERTTFTSIGAFLEKPALVDIFLELYEYSASQITLFRPNNQTVVITHSPCRAETFDEVSLSAEQARINFRFSSKNPLEMAEDLEFMVGQASAIDFLHVFGHVALSAGPYKLANTYWIDSGCVNGGSLSALIVRPDIDPYFVCVPSSRPQRELFDMSLLCESVLPPSQGEIL